MNEQNTFIEKFTSWIKNSVMLKLITITILMLLLLIPASMIKSIIQEREEMNNQATAEVSSKWADAQLIKGPILTIPLIYEFEQDGKTLTTTKYWQILPENLKIAGKIDPEKLRRGIYEVVVYKSALDISGNFIVADHPDPTNLKEIQYGHAFLTIGISDLRGIKNQIKLKWGENSLDVNPGSKLSDIIYSGVTVNLPNLEEEIGKTIEFKFAIDLQGSRNLSFTPMGSITKVDITSTWKSPSFNGNFLPDSRALNDEGFEASWSILQLNRNFPQSWVGSVDNQKIQESTFGVDLILPLDDYQKSFRSAKYAVMTIALTFLVFFLVEILNKRKIHPFQYALVGLAICLFYILLVSISEHSNFNFAYGLSTIGIVTMISLYSIGIFKSRKFTFFLIATLTGIYGFLFVTLQLADYALLLGSIGLTIMLGLTMYFTRNIDWYKLNVETE